MLEKQPARRPQGHTGGGPFEELGAELVFEGSDGAAERRLGDAELPGCSRDALLFSDCHEVPDLLQAHASIVTRDDPGPVIPKRYWPASRRWMFDPAVTIELYSGSDVDRLRRAGRCAAATLAAVGARLRAGISTAQIDEWVREDTARRGARPSQLGFHGFPAAVCVSRNDVVCHGIPSPEEHLEVGDIVNVDVTSELDGFHGDNSRTFLIGDVSPEARHVVEVARRCLDLGIAEVRPGVRLGDVGAVIEEHAKREGCSSVRDFCGHGIGREMHMPPQVPHYGKRGRGLRLRAGMVFTIEPMINLGRPDVRVEADGWRAVTVDGSLSAQFEHTILVTETGCEVLTRSRGV